LEHARNRELARNVGPMRERKRAGAANLGNRCLRLCRRTGIIDEDIGAPAPASAMATARPMPELAPVTSAFWPRNGLTWAAVSDASAIGLLFLPPPPGVSREPLASGVGAAADD